MAIILIVEDGTGVEDANTYITVEEAKKYASNRNIDLGNNDDLIAGNLILAADYMEVTGPYIGFVFNKNQGLEFPRKDTLNSIYTEGVPRNIKKAQAQLLLDIKESGALLTTNRQFALKRRKMEGLEQEWAVGSYAAYAPAAKHVMFDHYMLPYRIYAHGGGLIR